MARSVSFEGLADVYDQTRGGAPRGDAIAADLFPHVIGERVVELGVGTGVVAQALATRLRLPVLGIDLSPAMLQRARGRLGAVLAAGDIEAAPLRAGSVDTTVLVWVLQLVSSLERAVGEIARVTRPGGVVLVVMSDRGHGDDDITAARPDFRLLPGAAPGRGGPEVIIPAFEAGGFEVQARLRTSRHTYEQSPEEEALRLERRVYGAQQGMSDEDFDRYIRPGIVALRALPEPDRRRRRTGSSDLLVLRRLPSRRD